jgi:hypothetical protein
MEDFVAPKRWRKACEVSRPVTNALWTSITTLGAASARILWDWWRGTEATLSESLFSLVQASILGALVGLAVVPLLERVWNWFRAPGLIAKDEAAHYKREAQKSEATVARLEKQIAELMVLRPVVLLELSEAASRPTVRTQGGNVLNVQVQPIDLNESCRISFGYLLDVGTEKQEVSVVLIHTNGRIEGGDIALRSALLESTPNGDWMDLPVSITYGYQGRHLVTHLLLRTRHTGLTNLRHQTRYVRTEDVSPVAL